MNSKGIRFKVWDTREVEVKSRAHPFYFHMILGNNETVAPSEGYKELRKAFATINSIWHEAARAQGHCDSYMTRAEFIAANPVPYTKDSLRPKAKV